MFTLITWRDAVNLDRGCPAGAGEMNLHILSLFDDPSTGKASSCQNAMALLYFLITFSLLETQSDA